MFFRQDEVPYTQNQGFATGPNTGLADVTLAEFDAARATVNNNAQRILGEELFDRVIDQVRENYPRYSEGDLENPFRAPWYSPEVVFSRASPRDIELIDRVGGSYRAERAIGEFNRTLEGLANQQRREADAAAANGEAYDYELIPRFIDFDREVRALARERVAFAEDVRRRADPTSGFVGGLAGGVGASFTDPVNLTTAIIPGGTSASSILGVAVKGAIANAASEAIQQPSVALWHQQIGLEYGLEDAAQNTLNAAIFGGILEGGGSAVFRGTRAELKYREARARFEALPEDHPLRGILNGNRQAIMSAAEEFKEQLPPAGREALRRTRRDAAEASRAPDGVAPDAHLSAVQAADRVASGAEAALPEITTPPQRPEQAEPIAPEVFEQVDGRPVSETQVRLAHLQTDAETFQYKANGNSRGVTPRLEGAQAWDRTVADAVIVWERADGVRFVADGHQRSGLARRLEAEGHEPIMSRAFVYREADGWTAREARGLGALANIQRAPGDVIDVATALREFPDIARNPAVSLTDASHRDALALSRLSDDVFGMVRNRVISAVQGAMIGRYVADPSLHSAIAGVLIESKAKTPDEARFMIRAALESRFIREVQNSLFGPEEIATPTLREKMKLTDEVIKTAKKDARLFTTLEAEADRIEGTGQNRLDREGNQARAETGAIVADILQRLATRKGEISDMMNGVVDDILDKAKTRAAGAREVLDRLRAEIEAGRMADLMDRAKRDEKAPETELPEIEPEIVEPTARELDDKTADMFGDAIDGFPALDGDELQGRADAGSREMDKAIDTLQGCVVRGNDGEA